MNDIKHSYLTTAWVLEVVRRISSLWFLESPASHACLPVNFWNVYNVIFPSTYLIEKSHFQFR